MKRDKRVEEIMRKVRERIRRRGHYLPHFCKGGPDFSYKRDIKYIVEKADIRAERSITSHRKVIGPSLVKTRRFLHEEIMRAVMPMTEKQIDFNETMAKLLLEMDRKIGRIEKGIKKGVKNSRTGQRDRKSRRQMIK